MLSPSLLVLPPKQSGGWKYESPYRSICDLRGMHGFVGAVAARRWRDALFEVPFRQRTEQVAEPSIDRAMRA
jgi:hypothetical protein